MSFDEHYAKARSLMYDVDEVVRAVPDGKVIDPPVRALLDLLLQHAQVEATLALAAATMQQARLMGAAPANLGLQVLGGH